MYFKLILSMIFNISIYKIAYGSKEYSVKSRAELQDR